MGIMAISAPEDHEPIKSGSKYKSLVTGTQNTQSRCLPSSVPPSPTSSHHHLLPTHSIQILGVVLSIPTSPTSTAIPSPCPAPTAPAILTSPCPPHATLGFHSRPPAGFPDLSLTPTLTSCSPRPADKPHTPWSSHSHAAQGSTMAPS